MKRKIINPYLHPDFKEKGYNCFACAPHNPIGLHLEFYEEDDEVTTTWIPDRHFQGWLETLHGGIQATLIDEVSGWLISRKCQLAGMTTQLNVKYKKPVAIDGNAVEVRAKIREIKRNFVFIDCQLLHNGQLCSTADVTFFCFSKEKSINDFNLLPFEVEE
ncbi:MAG: PaaI family thioesterase [Paludibacteraceae bacterium]|nr:PaaI family thioesterase [Paludibacteraceae bacterium]